MLLKCDRCGAPLEVPPGINVRCPYCGTTAVAPAPQAPAPAPPHTGPGYYGYGSPQELQERAARLAGVPQPVKSARTRGAVTGLVTTAVIVVGVAASLFPTLRALNNPALQALSQAASDPGHAQTVATTPISWNSSPAGCLIDANGDGISDVAGLSGPSQTNQATVVDGKTGQILFTAPAVKKAEQLACLGDYGFLVVEANFQLDFYTARSPWGKTQVMARDKVSEYGVGTGCVQLRTDDGTTQGVQLPGGAATTCPASPLHRYYGERAPGMIGLTDSHTDLMAGARKYDLDQRASGTEILTVKVSENGKPIWSKELTYASCTFGAAIAVAPGKIMIWAAEPGERNKGLLIGLDAANGNQIYEVPIADSVSNSPEFFRYNGKYVLAVNWGALRAYDPATGAEAWRVGR
ncbi:MAG: PQQ-binding-like beta-propeller repeat protein [Pseudomonadota bacterium]